MIILWDYEGNEWRVRFTFVNCMKSNNTLFGGVFSLA